MTAIIQKVSFLKTEKEDRKKEKETLTSYFTPIEIYSIIMRYCREPLLRAKSCSCLVRGAQNLLIALTR